MLCRDAAGLGAFSRGFLAAGFNKTVLKLIASLGPLEKFSLLYSKMDIIWNMFLISINSKNVRLSRPLLIAYACADCQTQNCH
jgi:hypothetical protein